MNFRGYIIKRSIEDVFIYPFILIGRLMAMLRPLPKEYRTFYFFPFYHTGGAEKVHALIAKATGDKDCIIFFTRRSVDNRFLEDFRSTGCEIRDISKYIDSPWLYVLKFIWRGKISGYINSQRQAPVVFNGQSNFGYKLSPWIKQGVKQVELIHSFNTFSWIRLPFLPFITQTVMISRNRIDDHLLQYRKVQVPKHYEDRIHFIRNAIALPSVPCNKKYDRLKILFVGRGTPEKRPGLFVDIARAVPSLQFTLVGEMPVELTSQALPNTAFMGNVDDEGHLHEIYCAHHVLIIPSSTEGFPIVLMEAMARGCAVMATPVGDIPYHINYNNGYLFSSTAETTVIREAKEWLEAMTLESAVTRCNAARGYAIKNFGIDRFNQQYKAILQP